MGNRKRINCKAVCCCSGDNGSYETYKKAHRGMLNRAHQDFLAEGNSFIEKTEERSEPSPDTMVYLTIFGIKKKVKYSVVKSCGWNYSWI